MSFFDDLITKPAVFQTLDYSRSARTDFRFYGLLLVGLVFIYAGVTIDPASNCSEDGQCAPWLVPIAFGMGVLAALAGAANLSANPKRGSRVDGKARQLLWWNDHLSPGIHAIALDDVARIRVETGWDDHRIYLIGHDGKPLAFPRAEIVPWPYADWARTLAARFPHITVEVME